MFQIPTSTCPWARGPVGPITVTAIDRRGTIWCKWTRGTSSVTLETDILKLRLQRRHGGIAWIFDLVRRHLLTTTKSFEQSYKYRSSKHATWMVLSSMLVVCLPPLYLYEKRTQTVTTRWEYYVYLIFTYGRWNSTSSGWNWCVTFRKLILEGKEHMCN